MVWAVAAQAGASLLGGMLGNSSAKKEAAKAHERQVQLNAQSVVWQANLNNDAFNKQMTMNADTDNRQKALNDQSRDNQLILNADAYNRQQALMAAANQEVHLLNDRVDAYNRDILDNHSTSVTTTDSTANSSYENYSTSAGAIDFGRMVRDAEAAGFNPLTVLRAGGLAGYATTVGKTWGSTAESSSSTVSHKAARETMGYFAPSSTPQGPGAGQAAWAQAAHGAVTGGQVNHPGQAQQATLENPWMNAVNAGINAWNNHDPGKAARQQLEMGLTRAQIDNLTSDTALNGRSGWNVPTYTGNSTVASSGGVRGAINSALGGVATPTPGEVKVTNPWPHGVVNPTLRDAAAHEDRYGEVVGSVMGVVNFLGDAYHRQTQPGSTLREGINSLANEWSSNPYAGARY